MAKFYPPDYYLQNKIGSKNGAAIFSPEATAAADAIIAQAATQFAHGCQEQILYIEQIYQPFKTNPQAWQNPDELLLLHDALALLHNLALNSEHNLVVALTKSLLSFFAQAPAHTAKNLAIVEWHITSINTILTHNITGDGGAIGHAMIAEVAKIRLND